MSPERRHRHHHHHHREPVPAAVVVAPRPPRWAFVLLCVVVFLLPLPYGSNRDWAWPWFALGTQAIAALYLFGVALGRYPLSPVLRNGRWFVYALVAWMLYTAAFGFGLPLPAAAQALDTDAARRAAQQICFHGTLALLVLALVDTTSRLRRLAYTLFAAGVVQAVYASFMTLSGVEYGFLGPKSINMGVATGTYINRNHLAGLLEMTGSVGIGLLVTQMGSSSDPGTWRKRLRALAQLLLGAKTRLRVLLAAQIVGLVLTQSRMGNLAFYASLSVIGCFALIAMRPVPRRLLWLLVSLVMVDLLILGSWFGVERVATRLQETTIAANQAPGGSSDAERVDVSTATLALWRQHPWLGVGPGGFRSAFPAVKPASVTLFYDHAHNDWAQRLAEYGIIGTALWTLSLGLAFASALAAMSRRRRPELRGIAFGAAMAMLALSLHALVDFNWQIPANAAYFQVLMAMGVCALAMPRNIHGRHGSKAPNRATSDGPVPRADSNVNQSE